MDPDAEDRIDDVLLVMSLARAGRPFGEFVTDGVGVELPSRSSPSPSPSFSRSSAPAAEREEVVCADGDFR